MIIHAIAQHIADTLGAAASQITTDQLVVILQFISGTGPFYG